MEVSAYTCTLSPSALAQSMFPSCDALPPLLSLANFYLIFNTHLHIIFSEKPSLKSPMHASI